MSSGGGLSLTNGTVGLQTCGSGEVLRYNGTAWACGASPSGVTTSGGLTVTGGAVGLQSCATGEILRYSGTTWACAPGASGANGRNLFSFDSTVASWGTPTYTGTPFAITANTADTQEGDASFDFAYGDVASATGIVAVWGGSTFIPVDPTKTYEGRIKARNASSVFLGTFWAGFIAYSAAKTPLQGPSSIFLSGPTRCVPFIANAVPAASMSTTWQQYTGRVQGEGAGNNQFPVGTRYIKPCVGTNLAGIGTTRLDAFEIFELNSSVSARVTGRCNTNMTLSGAAFVDLTGCPAVNIVTRQAGSGLRVSGEVGYLTGINTWWRAGVRVDGTNYTCNWSSEAGGTSHALAYNCMPRGLVLTAGSHTVQLTIDPYSATALGVNVASEAGGYVVEEMFDS